MTDDGYLNLALKMLKEEIKLGSDLMSKQFKSVVPFGMKKLTPREQFQIYENLDVEKRSELRGQFGNDWDEFVNEMESQRSKFYAR